MKELRNTKFYAVILITIMFTGIFSLSPAISSQLSNVTIGNSGTIAFILPLHVEGRYIKDALGNIVYLRGLQKVEFRDDPDGIWMGDTYWKTENVITELGAMKSWGANVVRIIQSVEQWKFNMNEPYAAIPNRQAIKEFLTLTAERGVYVIFTLYSIRNYWNSGTQDPLPYPPYQTSPDASSVIANEPEFVNLWTDIATELKDYQNVIFELWNEPTGDNTAKSSWFTVAQQCVDAIRATGANQLIIFQWQVNSWVNLDYPPPNNPASTMDWVWEANIIDPTGNLVYSTHIYRYHNSFHFTGSVQAWERSDIERAFQYFKFPEVIQDYPLFITEVGAWMDYAGTELEHELSAWNSTLSIFNEWGISYVAHWWREILGFRLLEYGQPWVPPPTESGLILIEALTSS